MPQPLALDTVPAAEAQQIAVLRRRTPEERLALVCELSTFALAASRAAIRRAQPNLSALEQARMLAALLFGADRAAQVQRVPSVEGVMAIPAAILPIVDVLDQLQVPYYITGSIASTAYSLPRTSYDVDIVAGIQPLHVTSFTSSLGNEYYVDQSAIFDALAHRSSFNMTHHATGINIDVFIPLDRPFDLIQFARVCTHSLPGTERRVNLASPEDVLLNKLAWYELGNPVSDQQWRDVQGILRVQSDALDVQYLRHWAAELQLTELLEFAQRGERLAAKPSDKPNQEPFLP